VDDGPRLPEPASGQGAATSADFEVAVSSASSGRNPTLSAKFNRLASEWRRERNPFSSNPMEWAMCPSYQKIIGIGPEAVPLLLEELRRRPDHWFWALHVLTEEDPVPAEHRGHFDTMVSAWIAWGESHEFISSAASQ
jgi:hypothetical protein